MAYCCPPHIHCITARKRCQGNEFSECVKNTAHSCGTALFVTRNLFVFTKNERRIALPAKNLSEPMYLQSRK